jgi:hypothetical protein
MLRSRFSSGPLALLCLFAACRPEAPDAPAGVTSHLSGTLAAPDTLPGPYEVLVLDQRDGAADTLGYAMADPQGRFSMIVEAPDRGVYPLVIARQGRALRVDELAVAEGDSARLRVTIPTRGRPLRVRSRENDAWMAYRNARAQHGRLVQAAVTAGDSARARLRDAALQTSAVLWSLRETFPRTMAAEVGGAESITLLVGHDDARALERAALIGPAEAGYADVAEAARRAEARRRGLAPAAALLGRLRDRAEKPEAKARIQASLVTLYLDSLRSAEAIAAADRLARDHTGTAWVQWAERARYEAERLLPGMAAPALDAPAYGGGRVRLADLRGKTVLLEFFDPAEAARQALPSREVLLAPLAGPRFEVVSVALTPDTLAARAFFSQHRPRGRPVVGGGFDGPLARSYNVQVVPTYYLIGPDGAIRSKYTGATLLAATEDARRLIGLPPLGQ